ncbi:hypothetical protein K525DRAFT_268555 [Schizophyllum commune Loenen D]|nr:hypothetical protein K525DRAFT_268555 [Schizophyllum commune Loenen D]
MTAIEAPWRVKTRPCPFYQQGKCLFAESCNFLHNVQIKVPGGPTVIHASPPSEVDVRRTPEGPAVIVDSPHSYRSPPRSPRMNNLLDALKGVIGEDEDVDDSDESEGERAAPAEDVRPTPEAEPPTEPDRAVPDAPQPTNEAQSDPPPHVVGLHQDREQSPEYEEDSSHSTNSAPTPDILSPVELSHLRLSGLDQLSHAKGNNSFDSGYAEQWQSPRPFALSPPRSPSVVSTFGLLSSPFGSPSERVFGSPLTQRFSNIPPSPLLSASFAHNSEVQDDADVTNLEDDLDSPNAYRASVASSMTMEAATDVTEDLSFEAGEGSGVTDMWDTFGQPTAMYSEPQATVEAPEEEEDVVDAYGDSPALHIGPEHDNQVLFEGDVSMDSSFDSITAKRISFSDADAQSTFHGLILQRSPLPSHEEPGNESWQAQDEPATPMPEEHDIVTDYEHMDSDEGDLSDDTIDLHAEGDTTEYTAVDDTISSFGQAAPASEVDDTISSFGQAAEPPAEDATWSSFGHTGQMTDDTAELAYDVSRSPSPTVRPGENDTLQNLYDHYSVASSPEAEVAKRSSLDDIPETSHTAALDGEGAEEAEGAVHFAEQSPAVTAQSPALTERNVEPAAPSPSPPQDVDAFTIDDYAVEPPSPATELDQLMADVAHVNQATPPTPRDAGISPPTAVPGPSPHSSLHSIEYVADALTPESLHSREVETPPYDDYYDLMSPEASDPPQPLVQDDAQHTPAAEDVQHTPMVEAAQHSPVIEDAQYAPVLEDAQHPPVLEAAQETPAVEAAQSWPVTEAAQRSSVADATQRSPVADVVQPTPVLDDAQHSPVVDVDPRLPVAIDSQQTPVVDDSKPVSPVTQAQSPPQAVSSQHTPVMEVASFMLSAEDPFAAEPMLDVQFEASEGIQSTPQVEDAQLVLRNRPASLTSILASAKSTPVSGDAHPMTNLDEAPFMPSATLSQPAPFVEEEQATPPVLDAQLPEAYVDVETQGHSIPDVQSPPADEVVQSSPFVEDAHLSRPHSVEAEADQEPSSDTAEHFASSTPTSPHNALAHTAESTPPLSVFDAASPSAPSPSDSIASSTPRDVADDDAQQTPTSDSHGSQSPSLDAEPAPHSAVEDEDTLPPPSQVEQHVDQAPSHTHDDGAALSSVTSEDGVAPEVPLAKAREDMARSTSQEARGGTAGPGLHEEEDARLPERRNSEDVAVPAPSRRSTLTSVASPEVPNDSARPPSTDTPTSPSAHSPPVRDTSSPVSSSSAGTPAKAVQSVQDEGPRKVDPQSLPTPAPREPPKSPIAARRASGRTWGSSSSGRASPALSLGRRSSVQASEIASSSRPSPTVSTGRQSIGTPSAPSPLDAFRQRTAGETSQSASPISRPSSRAMPMSRPASRAASIRSVPTSTPGSPFTKPESRPASPFGRPASRATSPFSRPASRAKSPFSRPASRASSPPRRPVFTPPPLITRGRSGTIKPASRESSFGAVANKIEDEGGEETIHAHGDGSRFFPSSSRQSSVDEGKGSTSDSPISPDRSSDSVPHRRASQTASPRIANDFTLDMAAFSSEPLTEAALRRMSADIAALVSARGGLHAVEDQAESPRLSAYDASVPPSPHVIALNSPMSPTVGSSAKTSSSRQKPFVLGSARDSSLLLNRAAGKSPVTSPQGSNVSVSMDDSFDGQLIEEFPAPPSTRPSSLKPLRLSMILQSKSYSSSPSSSPRTSSIPESPAGHSRRSSAASYVSSSNSPSDNFLLSSARSSLIPGNAQSMLITNDTPSGFPDDIHATPIPRSAPASRTSLSRRTSSQGIRSAGQSPIDSPRVPIFSRQSRSISRPVSVQSRPASRPVSVLSMHSVHDPIEEETDNTIRRSLSSASNAMPSPAPSHAIATPRPTLMFAIASDDVDEVRRVLESGEAGPNDAVGPQSALAFTLSNDQLQNKLGIVKALLEHGADPAGLTATPTQKHKRRISSSGEPPLPAEVLESLDPATKYYIERADDPVTRKATGLLNRSFFRPLARGLNYQLIGQDRALEQLYRVLSIHSHQPNAPPMVVMLCGPSGLGKSFLADKFGALLDVPTHTVNMTAINTPRDLWQSYSLSSQQEENSDKTLAQFLVANEKKRCVVVLDEIEKVQDEKTLWSLLMPWELGRCSFDAGGRTVDTRNVVWIGTSNLGHDLVFEHHDARDNTQKTMSREEYMALMALLRPRISDRLGASLVSRISALLPFVPFTDDEKRALAAESLYTIMGEGAGALEPSVVNSIINGALGDYSILEGARSLYRSVSYQLVDAI